MNTKELDVKYLKSEIFKRVISTIIGDNINQNPKLVGAVCEKLGVTYESQQFHIENAKPSIMNSFTKSIMNTIDMIVDEYVINHNGVIRTPYEGRIAQEAAVEAIVEDSDVDNLGSTLADMIVDLAERTSSQIKDMAKYVLRLEKQSQDSKKEELLEENSEIEEENQDNGGDSPFEEENNDGEGTDGESAEADDPFNSDASSGSFDNGDSSGGSDNPFDDGGDSESEKSEDDNPFGGSEQEGEGSSDSKEDAQEGGSETKTDNPFESVNRIGDLKLMNGAKPFYGLESGDLTAFITNHTKEIFYDKMKEAFETHGMESQEYRDLVEKFSKSNKVAMETVIGVLSFCSLMGLKCNKDVIKYSELDVLDK